MNSSAILSSHIGEEIITWKQRTGMSFVCGCLFLLVYVLTAGPMVKLLDVVNVDEFKTAVKYFYAPVVFLVEKNVEPFASVLKWYISLFK